MKIINLLYNVRAYAPALVFGLMLVACSSGDEPANNNDYNRNANTTQKSNHATRIEVPKLHDGTAFLLLEKNTPSIGVNYMIEWDCAQRAQRWSCWEWNSENSNKNWNRNNWKSGTTFNGYGGNGDPFQPDTEISETYRSELNDYSGSGYNRGHICASEDRVCDMISNGQTFYLSNIHPQIYEFNDGVWVNMENKLRNWRDTIVKQGGTMYVCKGGTIYDVSIDGKKMPGVIKRISGRSVYDASSSNGIPVPKYFFMAVIVKTNKGYNGMAFWVEHKADNNANLQKYIISIDELESRTGYDFFCNLPDNVEEAIESTLNINEWR